MVYYLKYLEIALLPYLDSRTVIQRLELIFAHHGIPETVFTNRSATNVERNGSLQKRLRFWHSNPSPYGLVEAAVKIAKRTLGSLSPNLALLLYQASSITLGFNLAQLLMNRILQATIPSVNLGSRVPDRKKVLEKHSIQRANEWKPNSTGKWKHSLS